MPSGARWCGTTFPSHEINGLVIEFFQGAKQVGHRTGDQCEQLKRIGNTKLPTVYVFARNGSLATAALMRRTHPVEASPPVHFSEIAVYGQVQFTARPTIPKHKATREDLPALFATGAINAIS